MAIEKLNIDWKNKGESGYENSKMNKTKMKNITDKIDELVSDIKLLWTNPNPNASSFSAQTVQLNSTQFDYYKVVCWRGSAETDKSVITFEGPKEHVLYMQVVVGTTTKNIDLRKAKIQNNTCVFEDATRDGETANFSLIPLYIIGYNVFKNS